MRSLINLIVCSVVLLRGCCSKDEIQQWIYQSIDECAVNFRNLNGTHEFGSSSSPSGTYGVVHIIRSLDDAITLVNEGVAWPYVAVLLDNTFNEQVMDILLKSDKISGVVVSITSEPPSDFSFDSKCPNSYSENCHVNPYGNSFLLKNWPFSLILVENSSYIKTIEQCYNDFNVPFGISQYTRSLCSLHMKNHMFAAGNSEICIRRNGYTVFSTMKYCDPLGGHNIILPMGNLSSATKDTVIISARLDVASMFDGIAPGAMSSVSGIVTLLAAANIFKNIFPPDYNGNKSVIFILFNGEAYDYIGSSRIAYDIYKQQFYPEIFILHHSNISLFVDVNQLSNHPLFLHVKNQDNPVAQIFTDEFINFGVSNNFSWSSKPFDSDIPTSFHSFTKYSDKMPGIVISNFHSNFSNRFYHGLYDLAGNLKYVYQNSSSIDKNSVQFYLGKIAEGIAVSLYKHMTGRSYDTSLLNIDSHAHLVDELLHCYLESNHCKYMQAVITKDIKIKEEPESLYVGVGRGSDIITKLTGRILAYLTSPEVTASADNCTNYDSMKLYSYIWMNGLNGSGVCINSTLKFKLAVSPAFEIEDYNWTSGQYSTWTESAWQDLDMYLFLKPPISQEIITFILGVLVLVSSFFLVYCFNKDSLTHSTIQNNPCL